jgi:hypothetical protein
VAFSIIPAQNEAQSIANVLRQLHRAGIRQHVLIANGCSDHTAQVARQTVACTADALCIVECQALGLDIPRAVGLMAGLRWHPDADGAVFIDGDLRGSFGPHLEEFLRYAQSTDVCWCQQESHAPNRFLPISEPGLTTLSPHAKRFWQFAAFARVPLWISKRSVHAVHPLWVQSPGEWLAQTLLRTSLRLELYPTKSLLWLGHPSGSYIEHKSRETHLAAEARLCWKRLHSGVWEEKGRWAMPRPWDVRISYIDPPP